MDIKEAALQTRNQFLVAVKYSEKEGCDREHIEWMLNGIIHGYITGEKAHRWLGWAQAIICAFDSATLAKLKIINHKA